jgi:hypothetical protein
MADDFCPRQIIFTIAGMPDLQITATEQDGSIVFQVDVLHGNRSADLRALFFDFANPKLAGLQVTGDPALTDSKILQDGVDDLGKGANLKGLHHKFDIGLGFGGPGVAHGDAVQGPVTFTLSNAAHNLTLDDIAHQQFGAMVTGGGTGSGANSASKILTLAPAAPDAHDDSYNIFEDNGAGLNAPTHTPTDFVMTVLANDTDGDSDPLTITEIHQQPEHGTIAIAADGKSLIYTPEADYAGTVSVEYCISDGHGGQDHATATINLEAVADEPHLSWTVDQGSTINEMIITVTADQTDADSSEYLDSLVATVAGGMPAGATLTPLAEDPAGQPDQIVKQFVLTTANDTSYDFSIDFKATSVETSNGDTQTSDVLVPIAIDHETATQAATFDATDQSIWNTGDAFTFTDDRFLGVDTGNFNESSGGSIFAGVDGHVKLGFQSTLEFNGGAIDATTNYDLTVDSTYNHTTDWLNIDTSSLLTGGSFNTHGPAGSYVLAFLYDAYIHAYAGYSIDLGDVLGSFGDTLDLGSISVGPGSIDLINLDSASLGGTIEFPAPLDAFSIDFAWPNLTTSGGTPVPIDSSGASNNFLQLNIDLDQLVSDIAFDGVNPFDPPQIGSVLYADPDFLDVDLHGGLNFLQDFLLQMGDVQGILTFEDGSTQGFTFGDSLFFGNASAIDAAGNNDGHVDFTFSVAPDAQLTNDTELGFNLGVDVSVLSVTVGYDIEVASDSTTLGPLVSWGAEVPLGSVPIYDDTFALNFANQNIEFAV